MTDSIICSYLSLSLSLSFISKLGGDGVRFGDFKHVDCANLPNVGGHNPFTNTKFTRLSTQISKSIHNLFLMNAPLFTSLAMLVMHPISVPEIRTIWPLRPLSNNIFCVANNVAASERIIAEMERYFRRFCPLSLPIYDSPRNTPLSGIFKWRGFCTALHIPSFVIFC